MLIAGFQKSSFVDYPGQPAAVVFAPYCNFNCTYCHNDHILGRETIHHMKSLCEAHRGNWEEALLHSTVTVKAWPGEALGWYQLGNVSQQLGDTRLTEECYRNTLRHLDNRRGHLAKRVMARLEEILSTHQDQTANASPPPCNN